MASIPRDARRAIMLLHATFFLSGFCALVYQVAWQRMLGLFSGSDTVSATIVVAAFLFGLGAGSLAGAHLADRVPRAAAITAFALCELGIALCAALSPLIFYDLIAVRLIGLAGSWLAVTGVVFSALLLPTLLMGVSLPLLARAIVREIDGAAERIGWLYGLNTLGAGLGAIAAGAVIIGTFGYEVTVYFGALLNAGAGLTALFVASSMKAGMKADGPPETAGHAHRPAEVTLAPRFWGWCALVFASGFLIISLEIVWFRVLGTLASTNAYAFSLILGVFLLADAAGIIAGAGVVRRVADPLRLFLRLQGGVTIYALATLLALWTAHAFDDVANIFIVGGSAFIGGDMTPYSGTTRNLAWLLVLGVTVAPPAFLLGMSFPIAQKAVQDDPSIVGLRVGVVQLANILGNTVGAVASGLVLLDLIGTSGTVRVIGVLGLALFALSFRQARPAEPSGMATATILAALIAFFPGNTAFWAGLHGMDPQTGSNPTVAEDRTGIVVMYPHGNAVWMFAGGHAQSRVPFLTTHGVLGAVGVLIHPDPRSILIIGHGLGSTAYAAALATEDPAARVRVIEIVAPAYTAVQTEASKRGPASTLGVMLADPRITRHVGDGRHAIFADTTRYDVIEADALRFNTSQSGLLYSVEFFLQVRDRLAPGGIAVQWAPTPRSEAGFLQAFPHVVRLAGPKVMRAMGEEEEVPILLGSIDGPVPFDREALARRLATALPRLAAAGWSAGEIAETLLNQPVEIWAPDDPRPADVNADLFPKDEYYRNPLKIDLLRGAAATR